MFNLQKTLILEGHGSTSSTATSIIILIALVVFTFWCLYFMRKNRHRLDEPKFISYYGSLYVPAWADYGPTLLIPFFFCLRRLLTATIVVWITVNFYVQVIFLSWLCLFMTAWSLETLPMDNKTSNFVFIFNEHVVLFACDFLLVFSDYVTNYISRYNLGFLYLAFFYLSCAVNVYLMLYTGVKNAKIWYAHKK